MSYLLELENTIVVMKSERRNVYILMGYAIFMVFKENNRCVIFIRTRKSSFKDHTAYL